MEAKRLLRLLASLAIVVLTSACTQKNTGDQPDASTVPQGLNRFLLFPNPLSMNSGGFETNTTEYADAYYRAIDPGNLKDTIDKWKTQNGFGSVTGTELLAVFRDTRDLGYGRRMTGRKNADGSIAFFVENYNVTPNASGDYSSLLNVEAAIRRDTRWHVGTNAIEWSETPCIAGVDPADCSLVPVANRKFAKFYNFSSRDGTRQTAVDLDGNGLKAMPGPCITCHGGRGDPLTPNEGNPGKPRFPLAENSVSRKRGDVQARLHGMNVDTFGFSPDLAGFSRNDQEATLKTFNQWILCTYPLSATSPSDPTVDACRPPAGLNEWQGTAAEVIKAWYGGTGTNGMPNPSFADTYVPLNWRVPTATQAVQDVYTGVVAPYCRTCHILRGTKNQDDLDFMTPVKMLNYADRIKAHVFDRGTMPLAKIVYNGFWSSGAPSQLANFINPTLGVLVPAQTATDSSGAALKPGRPIATPGPDRMVRTGSDAILTAENSLFATTFDWAQDPANPAGASIASSNSMITTFNSPAAGDFTVTLTVGNGTQTDQKSVKILVRDDFPDPLDLKFAHVKNVLQSNLHTTAQVTAALCTDCHKVATTPAPANTPPIWYTDFDRDGSGTVDTTDEAWFLKAIKGRVNLTEIEASPLLRKPTGNHHNGKMLLDTADLASRGGLSDYSILYNWIIGGMQGGGVAANPGANSVTTPLTLTFAGVPPGPFTANIPLDGTDSIGLGTLSYLWTISSQPAGGFGTFPGNNFVDNNASTTLTVRSPGTYVVRLQVSDGASTDTALRTIVVAETPLAYTLTVAGLAAGNVPVSFTGNPPDGKITVTTAQSTGNPVTCDWQVGPTVANPFATGVSVGPSSCSGATLNVTTAAIGSQFTVSLTQQNLSLPSVTVSQTFTATAAAGSNPSGADFNPITTTALGWTVPSIGGTPARTINSVTLQGSATGPGTLNFSWTATVGSAGCSIPAGASTSTTKVLSITSVGTCSVTMTVSNGILPNGTSTKTVTISSATQFANVAAILGNPFPPGGGAGCTSCHSPGNGAVPSWVDDGGLRGRLAGVITGTSQSSLLLVCPSNPASNGSCTGMPSYSGSGFSNANLTNYNAFLTWIINGQP